jgi:hypothetical protein
MRRLHFSIAWLMALVLLVAAALAALRHPSPLLASALYTLDAGLVCVAVLGGLFCRGTRRRTWTGFAVFAGAYLALALANYPLTAPSLLTTWGLSYIDARRETVVTSGFDFLATNYFQLSPPVPFNPASTPFFQVGHCLAALVAGLVGAGVAVLMGRESGPGDRVSGDDHGGPA